MNINEQDIAVSNYLKEIGVSYKVLLVQTDHKKDDDWLCDQWLTIFNAQSFDYFTGTGHRVALFRDATKTRDLRQLVAFVGADYKDVVRNTKELKRNPKKGRFVYEDYTKTAPPTPASVLYSLLLDSDANDTSFSDWCANFGYDTDSRKAEKTYFACQENADKVNQIFTREQREHLNQLLEDY